MEETAEQTTVAADGGGRFSYSDFYSGDLGYDPASPASIEARGRELVGRTFGFVCEEAIRYDAAPPDLYRKEVSKANKGQLGTLVEFYHFHRKPNSDPRPDFPEAGVELKVTPFRVVGEHRYSAKERLVVTIVDFFRLIDETFETSHFWIKARLILLVCYEYEKELSKLQYRIRFVQLFTPPEDDLPTIRSDWERIREKVRLGLAHELHCSDTVYLEACPKGANRNSLRPQPRSFVPAMQRAFAFKSSYMTYVLNRDVVPRGEEYERILPRGERSSVEEYALRKIGAERGADEADLFRRYGVATKAKNRHALLVFRILGIRNNRAEEFVKAGIEVKTLRLRKDGMPKEDMSFPVFRFKDVAEEEWDEAEIADRFRETRFLFVAFREDGRGTLRLAGATFWSMPFSDLESEYRKVWQRTKDAILSGRPFWTDGRGRRHSAFPKKTESPVGHVRPHGRDAADTDVLPNGTTYTKQCFWLNRDYLRKQLGPEITKG